MATSAEIVTLVGVLKTVVDFVSDDKKVQKFYDDVGGIQKVADDLKATRDSYAATMRALNDIKDLELANTAASLKLSQRENVVEELEASVELDRRKVAEDRASLSALLKSAKTDADINSSARVAAEAAQDEAAQLLQSAQDKSALLDKLIADYKSKLSKLSEV